MEHHEILTEQLFEQAINYPDPDMGKRLDQLVGLDRHKDKLIKILGLLINPEGLSNWAEKFHPGADSVIELVHRRPPLVILAGDVGAGKTELAQTIGDAVAKQEKIKISLLPLSLSARGHGRVGQMTQLISAAFDHTAEKAKKLKSDKKSRGAVILLVDEADALAQSREHAQLHHEDKAGVNAFIRGVDRLGNGKLPAAVIMCTNRIGSLDPAIKRRAAEILEFKRPDTEERLAVLKKPLLELGLSEQDVKDIVDITGPCNGNAYGLTFSDLLQRLIPSIILSAYPDKKVSGKDAILIAKQILPTPAFKEQQL